MNLIGKKLMKEKIFSIPLINENLYNSQGFKNLNFKFLMNNPINLSKVFKKLKKKYNFNAFILGYFKIK